MKKYIGAKSILSKSSVAPDPCFGISYNMNLYRGCQHQCIYCDSRSTVYGIKDFAKIQVKKNAIELLETALKKKKAKATIGTGSMNDPYMPVEKNEKLVQRALHTIAKYNFPVHIITKSNLIERDIPVIQDISQSYAAVSITITTTDDSLARKIEPGAPSPAARLETIRKLADAGIYCGVILTPVLPYLTDKADNIIEIVNLAKEYGAKYILGWMGMTQRKGQRDYYYQQLGNLFPGTRYKYQQHFGSSYECLPSNVEELSEIFFQQTEKLMLPVKMNFFSEKNPEQLSLF